MSHETFAEHLLHIEAEAIADQRDLLADASTETLRYIARRGHVFSSEAAKQLLQTRAEIGEAFE